MSDNIRAFVAAETSEPACKQVGALLGRLQGRAERIRWGRPEQMHLTLAFLGDVSPDFIESCRVRLAEAVTGFSAFPARLKGVGAFPSAGRARVVWVGMDEGKEELRKLQAAVVRELVKIGFEPEKRPFSPHLTLGRLKIPADVGGVCKVEFESDRFEIDRLVLFQSILRPQGAEYVRLAEWLLARTGT